MNNAFTNVMFKNRVFLFLQGPHGPFFDQLATMLTKAKAQVWRIGFNQGDAYFWRNPERFIGFNDNLDHWETFFETTVDEKSVTDIVLYGDTRAIHAQAIAILKAKNITVHVFEEGYLRPYWFTYERNGANGHSKLMDMTVDQMREDLENSTLEMPLPPAHWDDTRQHVFYGALYHWHVMFRNRKFPNFRPHRSLTVAQEFQLYVKRLGMMPLHSIRRALATRKIHRGGFPYHLVLLQLEHDASFQMHSPFDTMTDFLTLCVENFGKGAPSHHHLVFKAHPLEDGRAKISDALKTLAKDYGLEDRIHYVRGGKLAKLLNDARTAVTVNSTAGQQVLWRGIPLKAFGKAVYSKPEFMSDQSLAEFFAAPTRPDNRAILIPKPNRLARLKLSWIE